MICLVLGVSTTIALKPKPTLKPLYFTENKGQWDKKYVFHAAFGPDNMFIEKNAFQYYFLHGEDYAEAVKHPANFWESNKPKKVRGHALKVSFIGANENAMVKKTEPLPFYFNYYVGNDPQKWASEVKSYQGFEISRLYDGVDLKLYTESSGAIKYDLVVAPHTNPGIIQLQYEGAEQLKIKSGYLYITTSVNILVEKEPFAYQIKDGVKTQVMCSYRISEDNKIGFELGTYDTSQVLIIDPLLIFSTYSGSTADNFGATATYDSEGNLYSAGITESSSGGRYPTTQGAFQFASSGGFVGSWPQIGFDCDITISKYNNDGTQLLYATYLGGTLNDYAHSLVVDNYDQLIVLGSTLSKNFPVSTLAYDQTHNDSFDIILTKFNKNGSVLIGSTFVGGSHSDGISIADTLCMGYMDHMRGEVIVDRNNDIIVGSVTSSVNFPVTSGSFQQIKSGVQDGCVFKIDSALQNMKWATYFGDTFQETLNAVDVDAIGDVYAVGGTMSKHIPIKGPVYDSTYHGGYSDAYIIKISANGNNLLKFKYWGSINYDQHHFVKVHTNGDIYALGQNFDSTPVTPGVYATTKGTINISCLSKGMDTLRFATRIGNLTNKNILAPSAFMVDICGNVYASIWGGSINIDATYRTGGFLVGAASNTANLPTTVDALQTTTDNRDFYLFELGPSLSGLLFGTYVGELGGADHVDGGTSRFDHRGIVYQSFCASCASGSFGSFPTTPNSYSPNNLSSRCSNASMKLDFRKSNLVVADFSINPRNSCSDSVVRFTNNSYHGVRFKWYINGVFKDTTYHYSDTFFTKGTNTVKLVVTDSSMCNIIDSLTKTFAVDHSSLASFVAIRDTCSPLVFFKNTSIVDNNASVPYLWNFGDGDTSTQMNPSHLYKLNGTYMISLSSNFQSHCRDTAFLSLEYDSASQILVSSIFPFDTIGCEPTQIHITNTGINGKQFYWYVNDVLAATTKNFDSTMKKGDYRIKLVVEDSATCKKSDSSFTRIYIFPDVTPDFSIQRDSCSLNLSFTNLTNTAPGDSVNYVWFFGDGDSSIAINPSHIYPSPGTYRIQLFANPRLLCVKQKDIWYFLDNNKNVLEADFTPKPATGCGKEPVLFDNISINGSKFRWYIDSVLTDSAINFVHTFDTSGTYLIRLIAIDSASCRKSDTMDKFIDVLPFADSKFTYKRDSCSPSVFFYNQTDTTGTNSIVFLWDFGDGNTASVYSPKHTYSATGTYNVTLITNPLTLCADTATEIITYDSISHLLNASFTLNDSNLCLPAYLYAINTSIGNVNNRWYLNQILKDTSLHYSDTLVTQGTYEVKLVVTNANACITSDSMIKTINVLPASETSFQIARDSCSLEVAFLNTSPSGTFPQKWLWDFGDGDTSTLKNPVHKYKTEQEYIITLISNPGTYCADTAEQTWLINGDTIEELFIPNVFTPNNDKLNDCFYIKGVAKDCDIYEIWIRNRWGNLFFTSKDPEVCWNGKNENGIEAAEGVYFYILKIKRQDGLLIDKSGTITLIRN